MQEGRQGDLQRRERSEEGELDYVADNEESTAFKEQ